MKERKMSKNVYRLYITFFLGAIVFLLSGIIFNSLDLFHIGILLGTILLLFVAYFMYPYMIPGISSIVIALFIIFYFEYQVVGWIIAIPLILLSIFFLMRSVHIYYINNGNKMTRRF